MLNAAHFDRFEVEIFPLKLLFYDFFHANLILEN